MRRHYIVSGILLILAIINFALAAPVLLEELDDGYAEIEKQVEEHFKTWGNPVARPDRGSTSVVEAPVPNRVSSTASLYPLIKPSTQSPWGDRVDAMGDDVGSYKGDDNSHWQYTPTSSGYSSDREFMEAHPLPDHPTPWTDSDSSTDPDLDRNDFWMNLEDPPSPRPASPEEFGQAHKFQVDPLDPPSTSGYAPSPPEPEHEVATTPPSPNLGSPKELEDHQSLSADSDPQPVDPQAAIYAAKGKAKESRRISGTARDVGIEAQRELQPAERSLDPGDLV